MEDKSCVWEADSIEIEASLHQIASGLQNATEGYLALASHISQIAPYELPQVIAQIPPPPVDVPMPIRKALSVDGESKVVNYLLHGEYKITNTCWSKLQKKYNLSKNKIYSALKGKRRPGGSQYWQKRKQTMKLKPTTSHTGSGTESNIIYTCYHLFFILGKPYNMALLMLLGYLVCNVLLAWATLQQPYISKSLSSPPP